MSSNSTVTRPATGLMGGTAQYSLFDLIIFAFIAFIFGIIMLKLGRAINEWRLYQAYLIMESETHEFREYRLYGEDPKKCTWNDTVGAWNVYLRDTETGEFIHAVTDLRPEILWEVPCTAHVWEAPVAQKLYHVYYMMTSLMAIEDPHPCLVRNCPPPSLISKVAIAANTFFLGLTSFLIGLAFWNFSPVTAVWIWSILCPSLTLTPYLRRRYIDWRNPSVEEGHIMHRVDLYVDLDRVAQATLVQYAPISGYDEKGMPIPTGTAEPVKLDYAELQEMKQRHGREIHIIRKVFSSGGEPIFKRKTFASALEAIGTWESEKMVIQRTKQELINMQASWRASYELNLKQFRTNLKLGQMGIAELTELNSELYKKVSVSRATLLLMWASIDGVYSARQFAAKFKQFFEPEATVTRDDLKSMLSEVLSRLNLSVVSTNKGGSGDQAKKRHFWNRSKKDQDQVVEQGVPMLEDAIQAMPEIRNSGF